MLLDCCHTICQLVFKQNDHDKAKSVFARHSQHLVLRVWYIHISCLDFGDLPIRVYEVIFGGKRINDIRSVLHTDREISCRAGSSRNLVHQPNPSETHTHKHDGVGSSPMGSVDSHAQWSHYAYPDHRSASSYASGGWWWWMVCGIRGTDWRAAEPQKLDKADAAIGMRARFMYAVAGRRVR